MKKSIYLTLISVLLSFSIKSQNNTLNLNPDINATNINVLVTGNLKTNDFFPIGTLYGDPILNPSNPNSRLPIVNPDGTYSFMTSVPGVYHFVVSVCLPGHTKNCPTSLLTISVLDPNSINNLPVVNTDIVVTKKNVSVIINTFFNDRSGNIGTNLNPSSVTIVEYPKNGTAAVDPITGNVKYNPDTGFLGKDTLKYRICDEAFPPNCNTAYQIIEVLPKGSNNVTSASDDFTIGLDGEEQIGNVLINDSDPEGNKQSVLPQNTVIPGKGTMVLNSDGSFVFTPISGYIGSIDFAYTVCDNGNPLACAGASIYILIQAGLDAIIPNYFSPNNDGVNEYFTIPSIIYAKHPNLKIIIYNRWGNIVWRSTGKYKGDWFGQLEGSTTLVPDGVYYI